MVLPHGSAHLQVAYYIVSVKIEKIKAKEILSRRREEAEETYIREMKTPKRSEMELAEFDQCLDGIMEAFKKDDINTCRKLLARVQALVLAAQLEEQALSETGPQIPDVDKKKCNESLSKNIVEWISRL